MKRRRAESSGIFPPKAAAPIFPAERDRPFSGFEKKVYGIVSAIPKGQTRSYKWVAARAGAPGASRAVGNALNKNPRLIAIPCHRVIRSDGMIGGYSGGAGLKKSLLESEGIDCSGRRCYNHT
jgi:O-6-methylguanine DNA methyltransferase